MPVNPALMTRKATGYVLLGAAAYWLWRESQPKPPLKPPADPAAALAFAINPRYQALPVAPNGALPADTESVFPRLPFSTLLQGGARPLSDAPVLVPWGQQPAYSQPIGPEFENRTKP